MKANDLRIGNGVRIDGKLYVVVGYEHRTPGNLRAFVQAKLRDVVDSKLIDRRFASTDELEEIDLDRREMEFLYADSTGATFMDSETYDQLVIHEDVLGNAMLYLVPNSRSWCSALRATRSA
ncbi:MAG: hypothetical protein IPJ41_08235 [Phycisphaerales bacterium]|nr:hypothetical protein [Phycisphaerales bacterium]